MNTSPESLLQSKIILLYLIHKLNLPVSTAHIQEFTLSQEYMDYFSLSTYLAEMIEDEHLKITKSENQTYYSITEKGMQILKYFKGHAPKEIFESIDKYTNEHYSNIKQEFEVKARYFASDLDSYTVKCGAYDDSEPLMEITINVASKAYAKLICENWKSNVNSLYINILKELTGEIPHATEDKDKENN